MPKANAIHPSELPCVSVHDIEMLSIIYDNVYTPLHQFKKMPQDALLSYISNPLSTSLKSARGGRCYHIL